MKKQAQTSSDIKPGQICGFFDHEVFRLGLIISHNDSSCQVESLSDDVLQLPVNRFVLLSETIYPIENPTQNLTDFQQQIDACSQQINLDEIRQILLQKDVQATLTEALQLSDFPVTAACRFALFLLLRKNPSQFRFKQGLCRALSETEQQEYILAEEQKALHKRDMETCPQLAEKGLPVLFSDALLAAAEEIPAYELVPDRMDLTELDCWTIDAASSHDLDDAISLTPLDEGWELGIHISDVSVFVAQDSDLDKEALRRSTSAYLPDLDVHMLPQSLSCQKASLLAGAIRPVLSIVCKINPAWEIASYLIFPAAIKVSRNLSYDEVDAFLTEPVAPFNPEMQSMIFVLKAITDKHLQKRIEQGARVWDEQEKSPSRRIVAECMVIYNRILADLVAEQEAPLFYRYSESVLNQPTDDKDRDFIPPSTLGTEPRPHTTMGLKVYAQMTSPLRRYSDLVNQRQSLAVLYGDELPYTKDQLEKMLDHLIQTRLRIRQLTLLVEKSVERNQII
ncbi:MAG: ribonuclease catalytic domain-containing protein [Candidatus Cloacimonadaceae bacterium]